MTGSEWPARTWDEHGRPGCGRWMGWANDAQPYLIGRRVELSAYAGLVLAEFSDGDRVRFEPGAPFRLAPP
jgi:hypothetical protein